VVQNNSLVENNKVCKLKQRKRESLKTWSFETNQITFGDADNIYNLNTAIRKRRSVLVSLDKASGFYGKRRSF